MHLVLGVVGSIVLVIGLSRAVHCHDRHTAISRRVHATGAGQKSRLLLSEQRRESEGVHGEIVSVRCLLNMQMFHRSVKERGDIETHGRSCSLVGNTFALADVWWLIERASSASRKTSRSNAVAGVATDTRSRELI
jgi:hypothetical protein